MPDDQSETTGCECGAPPGYHRGDCATGRATYDNIRATLGGVVPCYGEPTGCMMSDAHDCDPDCMLLRVYRAGERDGREACVNV